MKRRDFLKHAPLAAAAPLVPLRHPLYGEWIKGELGWQAAFFGPCRLPVPPEGIEVYSYFFCHGNAESIELKIGEADAEPVEKREVKPSSQVSWWGTESLRFRGDIVIDLPEHARGVGVIFAKQKEA